MDKDIKKQETFTLSQLIEFGYYVRYNDSSNIIMRKNYINWLKTLSKTNKPY
jgi:hypothetical protein